ncbi:MAG: hypothetical protein WB524_02340 [Acidobacteriaceae bacterium]
MREYKFLFDNDSRAAAKFFPEKRVITLAQAKVSTAASDAEIVARARELGAIIVTANGEDYEKEFKRFLQKSRRNDCYDLFGLVVIPNPAAIQERVLPGLAAKLRFKGKAISWDDVWRENYLVRVRMRSHLRQAYQSALGL